MKKPTWVMIAGILGIIFSCFGILGAGQEIIMPKMLEMQKEMFSNFEEEMRQEMERQGETNTGEDPFDMFQFFEQLWDFPEWFGSFSVVGGLFKMLINGLLLFAAIFLLQLKPFAINLYYAAAALSIAVTAVKVIVAISFASSIIGLMLLFGGVVGIIIDIVLIVVVVMGDKDAFYLKGPPVIA